MKNRTKNKNKNLKRTLSLSIALILMVTIAVGLSACGSNDSSNKGGSDTSQDTPAPKNRLEAIIDSGVITVATEPYFAPYEFIDPSKEGEEQYVGFDMEIAKSIAEDLGVELEIVPLEFSAVQASVIDGKYDLAISALAYTPARAENFNLSIGYFTDPGYAGYGLLVREEDVDKYKTAEDCKDAIIAVQSASLQEVLLMEGIKEYKEIKRVSATPDAYLMVQEGKADVAVCAISNGQLYAEQNAGLGIAKDFKFEVGEEYMGTRIGMQKGEDELTERINQILQRLIDEGKIAEWYDEYLEYAKQLGLK